MIQCPYISCLLLSFWSTKSDNLIKLNFPVLLLNLPSSIKLIVRWKKQMNYKKISCQRPDWHMCVWGRISRSYSKTSWWMDTSLRGKKFWTWMSDSKFSVSDWCHQELWIFLTFFAGILTCWLSTLDSLPHCSELNGGFSKDMCTQNPWMWTYLDEESL